MAVNVFARESGIETSGLHHARVIGDICDYLVAANDQARRIDDAGKR